MDILYVVIFCVIPLILLNQFSQKSQGRFIKRYRQKIDPNEPFYPNEINERYSNQSRKFFADAPKMLLLRTELFWRDYKDRELNEAAHQVKLYFIAMALVIVINFFIIAFFIVNR